MDEKYTEMKTAHIGSPLESTHWEENIILADATWMDDFVFDVTVNFERMLERPLPKASIDRLTSDPLMEVCDPPITRHRSFSSTRQGDINLTTGYQPTSQTNWMVWLLKTTLVNSPSSPFP